MKDPAPEALPSDIGSVLQRIAVVLLGFTALACAHAILYHLHYILAPFVLSGFLVFALEPTVNRIYISLAGLSSPYRWCCCCMRRRHRGTNLRHGSFDHTPASDTDATNEQSASSEEHEEGRMLLGDQATTNWSKYSVRILDGMCRLVAVTIVMSGMILLAAFVVYWLASGALRIKDNWQAYQKGMQGWVKWLDNMRNVITANLKLSGAADSRVRMVYTSVLSKFQESILELVNAIVGVVTGSVSFAVIVMLYMLFWLFQPLPINGQASSLVQNYIYKKAFVSALYGISVTVLLYCMRIDLPAFFGLISFFLNFVPEVGAFMSILAPVPLILLNGNIESPVGWVILASLGQGALKLLIGNVLEMRLISGDDEMALHPVWVLLGLNYFGFLWGPVGMLISVPLLATLKSIVIAKEEELKDRQPYLAEIAGQVSSCLEGRKRNHKTERRGSTWLLPFSATGPPSSFQKEGGSDARLPAATTADQPQAERGAEAAASKQELTEEDRAAVASVPKKSRDV